MDSNKFLGGKGGGYSKAHMCLQKILSIICSIPPNQQNSKANPSFHRQLLQLDSSSASSSSQDKAQSFGNQGFLIDLNLELTSSPETESNSDAIEANSNQEKNENEEKRNPVPEIDVEDEKKETEPFCRSELGQEGGSLANLLIETGDLSSANGELERGGLSSELETQEINGKESMEKGRDCRVADLYGRSDEASQVVRTKRGRTRVLPCRYKDSVLQPLARNSGSKKRQRLR